MIPSTLPRFPKADDTLHGVTSDRDIAFFLLLLLLLVAASLSDTNKGYVSDFFLSLSQPLFFKARDVTSHRDIVAHDVTSRSGLRRHFTMHAVVTSYGKISLLG